VKTWFAFGALVALLASGCVGADYAGTEFACTEADPVCPSGMACVAGVCASLDSVGQPDGPGSDSGDDDGADDDGQATPAQPDAGPDAPPDAGTPDAGTPVAVVMTFGERTGADVSGVTRDTWLDSSDPIGAKGREEVAYTDALPPRHALIDVDISAVPVGSTVQSAHLVLVVNDPLEAGTLVAKRLLVDWSERDATYLDRNANTRWPDPGAGGDSIDPTPAATFAPATVGEYRIEVAAAVVQGWVDDPASNHGLRWESTAIENGAGWHTRDDRDALVRPLLEVEYLPPL